MLKLGELGEVSFGILKLGELAELSFGLLKLGELGRIVLFYLLDVTSSIFIKQLRNRFGDFPKLYLVMEGGDI